MKYRKVIFLFLKIVFIVVIPALLFFLLPAAKPIENPEPTRSIDFIMVISMLIVFGVAWKVLYNLYLKDYRQQMLIRIAACPTPNNTRCTIDKIILHAFNAVVPAIFVIAAIMLSAKVAVVVNSIPAGGSKELFGMLGITWINPLNEKLDVFSKAMTQINNIVLFSAISWFIAFWLGILQYILDHRDYRRSKENERE